MGRITVTDEWLYQYMPIVDEALIRELEEKVDYEYQFSIGFEKRMKKLIKREARFWSNVFYRLSKRTAILLVCAVGALYVTVLSDQADRSHFFETVRSIWEDMILYSYSSDREQGAFLCKEPGYLPEGYQETDRVVSEQLFSVTYTNEEQEMITWDQILVQDGGNLFADQEYDDCAVKEIAGNTVVTYMYDDGFTMTYCECGEYVYELTADSLSLEEIYSIFSSTLGAE